MKCINCGAELAAGASFCLHCETEQTKKHEAVKPRLWRKKALIAAVIIIIAAVIVLAVSLHHAPQTYEGGAEVFYTDKDSTYQLFLCFDGGFIENRRQQDSKSASLEADNSSAMPSQLSVFDDVSGQDAQDAFFEKVESCTVEAIPEEDGKMMVCSEPAKDEIFTEAARVSHVEFSGDSGTNEIRWTLKMKNGDTIILKQQIYITQLQNVVFSPENAPMGTIEQLEELLVRIENEVDPDTVVDIYLPPITYHGGLTIANRTVNLYGGDEGENRTTFIGSITIDTESPDMMVVGGIRFVGNGGIGLAATAAVDVFGCEFVGWDVAISVMDGSWVTPMGSLFENNGIALKYDSSECHRISPNFDNNTFIGNDTALLLENVPTDHLINLGGCVFENNGTDIDNRTNAPVDISGAEFK